MQIVCSFEVKSLLKWHIQQNSIWSKFKSSKKKGMISSRNMNTVKRSNPTPRFVSTTINALIWFAKAINFPKWPLKEAQLHAILLTNRAACYIQLNADLDKCLEDCTLAIQEHPTYGKAFFRRSQAHELQGKIPEAFQGFSTFLHSN